MAAASAGGGGGGGGGGCGGGSGSSSSRSISSVSGISSSAINVAVDISDTITSDVCICSTVDIANSVARVVVMRGGGGGCSGCGVNSGSSRESRPYYNVY